MAVTNGNLNQSVTASLNAANNDFILISVRNPVATFIKHINFGAALFTATLRANFGWMAFQIIKGGSIGPTMNTGAFQPAPNQNVMFFDLLTNGADGFRDIDFARPIRLEPNQDYSIIVGPPTGLSGVGGIGAQDCTVTVLAEFGELNSVKPQGYGEGLL